MEASFESRNTRRSATNLHHLTLAPLSSRLPIDAELNDSEDENFSHDWKQTSTSYIQGRSAPTTPRILSRSSSRHRLSAKDAAAAKHGQGSKSFTHINLHGRGNSEDRYGGVRDLGLTKATTTGQLQRRPTGSLAPLKTPKGTNKRTGAKDNGEWLFRAGIAISSEARETKGQSWLVSRDSSTSLVAQADADDYDIKRSMSGLDMSGYGYGQRYTQSLATPGLGHGPRTPRGGHGHSRSASKPGSSKSSRRGSRAELNFLQLTTGTAARTPGSTHPAPMSSMENEEQDYFGDVSVPDRSRGRSSGRGRDLATDVAVTGPDFVDEEEETGLFSRDSSEEDEFGEGDDEDEDGELAAEKRERAGKRAEAEIAELAKRDKGFGFGSVVDRMINWTLFEVKDDAVSGPSSYDSDVEAEEEEALEQQTSAQKRDAAVRPADTIAPTVANSQAGTGQTGRERAGVEEGGWKDAAWLLSVASKILL